MIKNHTTLEMYIIEAVKRKREALKMSKAKLSLQIGLSSTVVSQIERYEEGAKYNMNQLNEIAKIFECKISDFFPTPYLEEDCVEEYHKIREARATRKKKLKEKLKKKNKE